MYFTCSVMHAYLLACMEVRHAGHGCIAICISVSQSKRSEPAVHVHGRSVMLRSAKRVARTKPRRSPEASPEVILAEALLRCLGHCSLGRGRGVKLCGELSCFRNYIINYSNLIIITRIAESVRLVGVPYYIRHASPHTSADSSSQKRIQGANVVLLDWGLDRSGFMVNGIGLGGCDGNKKLSR